MRGSRTIRVCKRDGRLEVFSREKLAGAIWRCGLPEFDLHQARQLACAVETYLMRKSLHNVSSPAIMEMAIKALLQIGYAPAAANMEQCRSRRHVGSGYAKEAC